MLPCNGAAGGLLPQGQDHVCPHVVFCLLNQGWFAPFPVHVSSSSDQRQQPPAPATYPVQKLCSRTWLQVPSKSTSDSVCPGLLAYAHWGPGPSWAGAVGMAGVAASIKNLSAQRDEVFRSGSPTVVSLAVAKLCSGNRMEIQPQEHNESGRLRSTSL